MKLMIKQKFLDDIKNGDKLIENRDAHLTLVGEETGEQLRVEIFIAKVQHKKLTRLDYPNMSDKEFNELFSDDFQLKMWIRMCGD